MGGNLSQHQKHLHPHDKNCERHNEQRIDSFNSERTSSGNEDGCSKPAFIIPQMVSQIHYEECSTFKKFTEEEINILKLSKRRSFDNQLPMDNIIEEPELEKQYKSNIKF